MTRDDVLQYILQVIRDCNGVAEEHTELYGTGISTKCIDDILNKLSERYKLMIGKVPEHYTVGELAACIYKGAKRWVVR